jgi:hypothetical protein
MKRHCGCRVWRVWRVVISWPCGVWHACYDARALMEHEEFTAGCEKHMPVHGATNSSMRAKS